MLKKMLVQGLFGAALIGVAAAVYSQVQAQDKPQDNGYLAAPAKTKDSDRRGEGRMHDMRKAEHRERGHDRNYDHD